MNTPDLASLPPLLSNYKDRHGGLIAFGLLEILFGALCVFSLPMTVITSAKDAQQSGSELDPMFCCPAC